MIKPPLFGQNINWAFVYGLVIIVFHKGGGSCLVIIYNVLVQLWNFLNFITTCFCLYFACMALSGLFKHAKLPETQIKHRFAAVIAARNEESVIANLIESLKLQDYPAELLDVIVVADNCDDRTAEVAQNAGAIVYKRFNKVDVGKRFVLKFVFEKIFAERDIYDAFCIFDADNVVDPHFVSSMNRAVAAGSSVAQGYRDIKNPEDTWISGGHALFYWIQNRFYNYARSHFGLSATINGTGYMVTADLLKKHGFDMTTVTEDMEFTMHCVLNGHVVGWVPEAVIYDEQPLTLRQSVRQRIRWTSGYIQVFFKYFGKYIRRLITKPTWAVMDAFVFLMYFPIAVVGIVSGFMCFLLAALRILDPVGFLISTLLLSALAFVGFWAIAIFTIYTEKKSVKKLSKAIWCYPVFNLTWVFIYVICIFKHSSEWKPIAHVRNISINDLGNRQ